MKNDFIKNIRLQKWHFYLLGVIVLNFVIGQITGYRLSQNLTFTLTVILYLTGLILFFTTIRPFKKFALYYSYYAISIVLIGVFFLVGGIFFALLSSLLISPIFPEQTKYESEKLVFYERYQGIIARCCSYEVVEPKLYFFEKHLGYINMERPINADKDEFSFSDKKLYYEFELESDSPMNTVKDTTVVLPFE